MSECYDDEILVSTEFSLTQAHAVLCWWAPTEDLIQFNGLKGWVCEEPFEAPGSVRYTPSWIKLTANLRDEERFHHYQKDEALRTFPVIHLTGSSMEVSRNQRRKQVAVSVISNTGLPWRRGADMRLRLRFAIAPGVELYGSQSAWKRFRRFVWSVPGAPITYRGECPGYWGSDAKHELMSGYKVAVCLENSCEPNYFTEKFVDAVIAGCIPVYKAHPSVANSILKSAKWVDPCQFGFSVRRTLDFALAQDPAEYQDRNEAWLRSEAVQRRSFSVMLEKACKALHHRWVCARTGA